MIIIKITVNIYIRPNQIETNSQLASKAANESFRTNFSSLLHLLFSYFTLMCYPFKFVSHLFLSLRKQSLKTIFAIPCVSKFNHLPKKNQEGKWKNGKYHINKSFGCDCRFMDAKWIRNPKFVDS